MNRPEKIPDRENCNSACFECNFRVSCNLNWIYNRACEDWEAYLPTEKDLFLLIMACKNQAEKLKRKNELHYAEYEGMIAKVIHERIKKMEEYFKIGDIIKVSVEDK